MRNWMTWMQSRRTCPFMVTVLVDIICVFECGIVVSIVSRVVRPVQRLWVLDIFQHRLCVRWKRDAGLLDVSILVTVEVCWRDASKLEKATLIDQRSSVKKFGFVLRMHSQAVSQNV